MHHTILVGVDGSTGAGIALQWAAAVGRRLGSPVRAVTAWQYPSDAVLRVGRLELADPSAVDRAMEQHTRAFVATTLGEAGDDVQVDVVRGPAASCLLEAADEAAPMTVVGSRGLGGFRGLLLGSISRQLCEHARRPVVVVPAAVRLPARLDTIAVGLDGSAGSAEAVRWTAWLAAAVSAKAVAVHAMPGYLGLGEAAHRMQQRRAAVQRWCGPLTDAGVSLRTDLMAADPRSALLDVAASDELDLLVVGARGHGTLDGLRLGSVASSLTQLSQTPVAVVPHPR